MEQAKFDENCFCLTNLLAYYAWSNDYSMRLRAASYLLDYPDLDKKIHSLLNDRENKRRLKYLRIFLRKNENSGHKI